MKTTNKPKILIVIFGATGDLAKRKLFPSIYHLYNRKKLSEEFAIVGVGRRDWTNETLRETVCHSIKGEINPNVKGLTDFCKHFYYLPIDVASKKLLSRIKRVTFEIRSRI